MPALSHEYASCFSLVPLIEEKKNNKLSHFEFTMVFGICYIFFFLELLDNMKISLLYKGPFCIVIINSRSNIDIECSGKLDPSNTYRKQQSVYASRH